MSRTTFWQTEVEYGTESLTEKVIECMGGWVSQSVSQSYPVGISDNLEERSTPIIVASYTRSGIQWACNPRAQGPSRLRGAK